MTSEAARVAYSDGEEILFGREVEELAREAYDRGAARAEANLALAVEGLREARSYFGSSETAYIAQVLDRTLAAINGPIDEREEQNR